MNTFIFTCGDINGIGPEIVIKTLNRIFNSRSKFVFICPKNVFLKEIHRNRPLFSFRIHKYFVNNFSEHVLVIDTGNFKQHYGKPTEISGYSAYYSIELALNICSNFFNCSLITAPISKEALVMAKIKFPGHTELIADWFNVKKFAMMFLSKKIMAALVTIHIPIKDVSRSITKKLLSQKLDVIIHSLRYDFKINAPKVALLGLNPHAGEQGVIGNEEKKIIVPFLNSYKLGKDISGPFSPDAFWGKKYYKNFDMVVGMYHDQVLIPFKLLNFNHGVNYTAGLPIVRTSPDHGTAFDIAGKGIANESSMVEAFYFARQIVKNRTSNG